MSSQKERLWSMVDSGQEEIFKICSDLIRIPSVTGESMTEIIQYVQNLLSDSGVHFEILSGPSETPSIIASVGQKGGKCGILNGHLDVVPPGNLERWTFSPYAGLVSEEEIKGRGASDMKAGVAILLFLICRISKEAMPLDGELRLHLVFDEETGGLNGSRWLTENGYAKGGQFCLISEPTTFSNVEVGQKGSIHARIKTHGQPFNSSVINYVGSNAVHRMIRIVNRLESLREMKAEFKPEEQELLTDSRRIIRDCFGRSDVEAVIDHVNVFVSSIDTGASKSLTPEECYSFIRFLSPAYLPVAEVCAQIEAIVCEEDPLGEVDYIRCFDGAATSPSEPLVQSAIHNASLLCGETVVAAHQWATSDAKYYRYVGIPTIQYGPATVSGIHGYDESCKKSEVVHVAKTYFAILDDLIGFNY